MKKTSRKKQSAAKIRNLEEIFPEEWVSKMRGCLEGMEKCDLDKPDKTFSTAARALVAYRCMGSLTLEYAPTELLRRIFLDADKVCARLGASVMPRKDNEVAKCLPANHSECNGSYLNPIFNETVACKCECHVARGLAMESS